MPDEVHGGGVLVQICKNWRKRLARSGQRDVDFAGKQVSVLRSIDKGATIMIHTHQSAPTQFVEANGIRFALAKTRLALDGR